MKALPKQNQHISFVRNAFRFGNSFMTLDAKLLSPYPYPRSAVDQLLFLPAVRGEVEGAAGGFELLGELLAGEVVADLQRVGIDELVDGEDRFVAVGAGG